MPIDPIVAARSRVGVAVRTRDVDGERNARQDLAAAKLAASIKRDAAGLRPEQRASLLALLASGGAA